MFTLISNLLALSPGTMPIEMRWNPVVLYVHVLHLTDIEAVRREILHLTDLTVRAFGSDQAIAEQAAYMAARTSDRRLVRRAAGGDRAVPRAGCCAGRRSPTA